jgi:hypothetical protein
MNRLTDYLVRSMAVVAAAAITATIIFVHDAPLEQLGAPTHASNAAAQLARA